MSRPASRLLAFLEMLQARPVVDGRAAATDLGVTERTIRRYAVALHDIGIPVDGQPGVGGGYRLRAGTRLPPLMLSDDEATAVAVGLVVAGRRGIDAGERADEDHPRAAGAARSPDRTAQRPGQLHRRALVGAADIERSAARDRRGRAAAPLPRDRLHARRRHAEHPRDRAARPRRASRPLVRPGARPPERRAAHLPRRPHRPGRDRRAGARARARVRPGRARPADVGAYAVRVADRGALRRAARGVSPPRLAVARRADAGRGGHAARDGRRLARVGGRPARRHRRGVPCDRPDELRGELAGLSQRLERAAR